MIQHIKKYLPETFVIAGNVGTPEAVRELENAGADATKVGIGGSRDFVNSTIAPGYLFSGVSGWKLTIVVYTCFGMTFRSFCHIDGFVCISYADFFSFTARSAFAFSGLTLRHASRVSRRPSILIE